MTLLVFLIVLIYLLIQFSSLPEQVPAHFNAEGETDRWGSKYELLVLPAVGMVLWIGMTVLEKYPHTYNYINLTEKNMKVQYRNGRMMINVLKNEAVLLFSYITWRSTRAAQGQTEGLFLPVFFTVLFASMLVFFIRMLRV